MNEEQPRPPRRRNIFIENESHPVTQPSAGPGSGPPGRGDEEEAPGSWSQTDGPVESRGPVTAPGGRRNTIWAAQAPAVAAALAVPEAVEAGLPPGAYRDGEQFRQYAEAPTLPRPTATPPPIRRNPASDQWASADRETRTRSAAVGADTMKIGIWGSPASGKTTYLAALQHALSHTDGSIGRWALFPGNEPSGKALIQWTHELISERMFPEATDIGAEVPLRWRFEGDLSGSRYLSRWPMKRRGAALTRFDLDLIDVSGEVFGYEPAKKKVSLDLVRRALDHLARAQGLIFLFDPITERESPIVVDYVNRTLTELAGRINAEGRTIGPYLPHYIAVCVTKFDDPALFQQAREAGLVNDGPDGIPRVRNDQAKVLFDMICDGEFWAETDERGNSGTIYVRNQLDRYFHPDRIRYYVTSSIGFRKGPGRTFNSSNFQMTTDAGGQKKILGPIQPINVLEPLVELHMQLRDGRGR